MITTTECKCRLPKPLSEAEVRMLESAKLCGRVFGNGHPAWRSVLSLYRRGLLDKKIGQQYVYTINSDGLKVLEALNK